MNKKTFDERQEHIRGKIAGQTVVAAFVLLMTLAFLESFDLFHVLNYVDFDEFLIITSIVILTFASLNLIWRDAYFGFMTQTQMRMIFYIFTMLSIIIDCLLVYDFMKQDFLFHSLFTTFMVNSIAVSLFCKRKDWMG